MGSNMDKIYIVMNYVEHDLKSLMETMKQPFLPGTVLFSFPQILRAGEVANKMAQMALLAAESWLWAVPCVALECAVFLGAETSCLFLFAL